MFTMTLPTHEDMPGGGLVTFWIDRLPVSLNRVGTRGHWTKTNTEKKLWMGLLEQQLMFSQLPLGCDRVKANALLEVYDGKPRDEGNFRTWLEKALGDALTGKSHFYYVPHPDGPHPKTGKPRRKKMLVYPDGRWLETDDDSDHFRFPSLRVVQAELPPPRGGYITAAEQRAGRPGVTRADWRKSRPCGRTLIRVRYWRA